MPQAFRYVSSTNFNPVATDYIISYCRNPSEFPVNRYVQLVQAPAPTFFYYTLERDPQIRLRNLASHVWADGADRPRGRDNQHAFKETQAFTVRYDYYSTIGHQALAAAKRHWDAKKVYLDDLASQAMTGRTYSVVTLLDTDSTWPSTNIADANTLNGGAGFWDEASDDPSKPQYNAIKKALSKATLEIFKQTNSKVKPRDLRLLLNPDSARRIGNTAELHNYMKYNGNIRERIEGDEDDINERYGLPKRLYGIEIIVEDSPIVNDLPTAGATSSGSTSRAFIKDPLKAQIISRPGKIDAQVGPSFSTIQVYWYEHQMQTTEFNDPKNLKIEMDVTDQFVAVVPAPESGFSITSIFASA